MTIQYLNLKRDVLTEQGVWLGFSFILGSQGSAVSRITGRFPTTRDLGNDTANPETQATLSLIWNGGRDP